MLDNYWWSSGAEANGGFQIANSLRFRATALNAGSYLHRTGFVNGGDVWTYSCWIKAWGPVGTAAQWQAPIFSWHNNSGSQTVDELFIFGNFPAEGRNEIGWFTNGSGDGFAYSNPEYQDPAAWYHVVLRATAANNIDLFVNGQEVTNWRTDGAPSAQAFFNKDQTCSIGGRGPANTSPGNNENHGEGYMADVYFLDGQALEPEAFGVENNNGVWVPRQTNFTSAQYGANGFHLDFHDPDNLGEDVAPTGTGHTAANNFTPIGFNTDPVGIFSEDCFREPYASGATPTLANFATTTDQTNIASPLADGFNGTDDNGSLFEGGAMVFRPATPIQNVTRIRSRQYGAQRNALNGTNLNNTSATNSDEVLYDDVAVTLTTWGAWSTSGNNGGWRTLDISINGGDWITLVDNTGADFDSMDDSPTQNYATLSPLPVSVGHNLSNANLRVTSTSGTSARPLVIPFGLRGRFYWEVRVVNNGTIQIGVSRIDNYNPNAGNFGSVNGCTITPNGNIQNFGTTTAGGSFTYAANDIVGLDYNSANNQLTFTRNGGNAFTVTLGETHLMVPLHVGDTAGQITVNYGQQPFLHRPAALTDANNVQTQNLPAATIANGRDHFRVVTATGANILGQAQAAATGFTAGLWWIKSRVTDANQPQHQLVDSVRGQVSGNWQALTSPTAGSEINYVAPAGNSVAWCWSAPDTWASTDADVTAGTIASNGRRNLAAGFSIISYAGTGANATVGHGLDEAPEFILCKNRDRNINWTGYHVGTDPTNPQNFYLSLNTNEQANNDSNMWRAQPNDSVISLGTYNFNNADGEDLIMYAWHSVPGYSAFGSYTGNGDANGPFIYTGFRPAFFMVKATDATHDWYMWDSTRSPNNGEMLVLRPNQATTEFAQANVNVDFVSNGIKIRADGSGEVNTANNFIWCAWAENPFGGNNVSPSNAR